MTLQSGGAGALEYFPCRYGGSRVLFRGPRKQLDGDYVAFLGGTATYGRFVEMPFPALLERRLSVACVNLGAVNAGVDLYMHDPAVLALAASARLRVVQVTGAHNMSNRYYQVHPRRNDRFLRASERLEALFPEVDFTEFHFTRHILGALMAVSEERYAKVVEELRMAWIARMKQLLAMLQGPTVLVWFADRPVPLGKSAALTGEPLHVNRAMLDVLSPRVAGLVEIVAPSPDGATAPDGLVYSPAEAAAAAGQLGPLAHGAAAEALEPHLSRLLGRND